MIMYHTCTERSRSVTKKTIKRKTHEKAIIFNFDNVFYDYL